MPAIYYRNKSKEIIITVSRRSKHVRDPPPCLPSIERVKLAFQCADTDTDTDTDIDSPNTATVLRPTHAISARESSRGSRRVCPGRIPRHRQEIVRIGRNDVGPIDVSGELESASWNASFTALKILGVTITDKLSMSDQV